MTAIKLPTGESRNLTVQQQRDGGVRRGGHLGKLTACELFGAYVCAKRASLIILRHYSAVV